MVREFIGTAVSPPGARFGSPATGRPVSVVICPVLTLQTDHFSRRGRTLPAPEAADVEPADEKPAKRPVLTVEELTELERLEDLDTCMVRRGPDAPETRP